MAQREAVLPQLLLEPRSCRAGLDPGRERDRIDLQHAVEPAQVEGNNGSFLAETRLDPADDAGAAAERHHRRPLLLAPGEHDLDLRLVAGEGDQVGGVRELAAEAADDVAVGLSESVRNALVALVAEQPVEGPGSPQPRRSQLDLAQRDRLLHRGAAEAEALPDRGRGRLQLRP